MGFTFQQVLLWQSISPSSSKNGPLRLVMIVSTSCFEQRGRSSSHPLLIFFTIIVVRIQCPFDRVWLPICSNSLATCSLKFSNSWSMAYIMTSDYATGSTFYAVQDTYVPVHFVNGPPAANIPSGPTRIPIWHLLSKNLPSLKLT